MSIAYPQPEFPNGIQIYVSEPAVPMLSSSSVIQAMRSLQLSSKARYNQIFEDNLKQYFNVPTACSVSNGYTGLFVIIKSLNKLLPEKDEVILPDATMVAVVNAVIDNNLKPVLVDNELNMLNPTAEHFISRVTPKTKAIIVTHTFGVPVLCFEKLVSYCWQKDIYLIEDIAEAIGVTYQGQFLGTFGHFASASLYANKLITSGDGGFILSKLNSIGSKNLQQHWKCIINHGFSKGYHFNHTEQTGNYRINGLGAAFISSFPLFIDQFISKRTLIDKNYRKLLNLSNCYELMENNSGGPNSPWVFALRVKDQQNLIKLRQHLANLGIETRPFFKPIHTQPIFPFGGVFPHSIEQYCTGLYLPTYHQLTEELQIYIAHSLNSFFTSQMQQPLKIMNPISKRVIDLLNDEQIADIISDLLQEVKKGRTGQIIPQIPDGRKLLHNLGMAIQQSQFLQIIDSQPVSRAEQSVNKCSSVVGKKVKVREENHDKAFGKECTNLESQIQKYFGCYSDYFDYEVVGKNTCIIWQKFCDQQKAIEEMSDLQLNEDKMEIAGKVALELFKFHEISSRIDLQELKLMQKISLRDKILKVKKQLDIFLQRFHSSHHLKNVVLEIIDSLIERESCLEETTLRIIHGKLSPWKILYDSQNQGKTSILDFQHLRVGEIIEDLIMTESRYVLMQFNELVIDQYLRLTGLTVKSQEIKERIRIIQIISLFDELLSSQAIVNPNSLTFREDLRRQMTLIMSIFSNWGGEGLIKEFQLFIRQNFQFIDLQDSIVRKINNKIKTSWSHHLGGWTFAEQLIQSNFQSDHSKILFFSALEKSFYDHEIIEPIKEKWCAFIHNVPMTYENLCTNLETLFHDSTFMNSTSNCVGLFCLTDEIKNRVLKQFPSIPCEKIYYPLTPPSSLFDLQNLKDLKTIPLVHVGQYLRNVDFFIKAKVGPNCRKYIVECQGVSLSELRQKEGINDVTLLQRLNSDQYEKMLCKSVIFLNLTGAGGCTTVVECITRNTPILINRLPSLEEYLGKEYPLFYESQQHVQNLLLGSRLKQKLLEAHFYLSNMRKQKLYPESFVRSFEESYIYQMLPTPNEEKKAFKEYDVSILLISYKRSYNIKKIVSKLARQTFKGSKELIIWNNNCEYSLQFIKDQFGKQFDNLVIVESSCNYYCYVRSAVAILARGKYLLFTDDDVFPKDNYVQTFVSSFEKLQKQHNGFELVITLKGNTFHSFHPPFDIQFWSNFDNVHFISASEEQQEIDVIHMDTCFMKRQLMVRCSGYKIPQLQYILIDDYWYSFVLSFYLNTKIIKIKTEDQIMEQCSSSEDSTIALYKQSSTTLQKNRFFAYHYLKGWPSILMKDSISVEASSNRLKSSFHEISRNLQAKQKQKCLSHYETQFSGFNVGSGLWKTSLTHLSCVCKCEYVRIGIVDAEKEFLCFFQKDGVHLVDESIIRTKLSKLNENFAEHNIKYILTLGNIPGKNEYCNQSNEKTQSWRSKVCLNQLEQLWTIIASQLVFSSNCIGYDLINEPLCSSLDEREELFDIYISLIAKIRTVDSITPIILEPAGGHYSELVSLIKKMEQSKVDNNLIYSFHFYDPYVWTSARRRQNEAIYCYPGPIPQSAGMYSNWCVNTKMWNKNALQLIFQALSKLRSQWNLKDYQVLLGEYGCRIDRRGIQQYFSDLHSLCTKYKISRLAYAFRQQWWPKMNYEGHPEAFQLILKDILSVKKGIDISSLIKNCFLLKSAETPWLDYNPFSFEIKQNQDKQLVKRIPIRYDIQMLKNRQDLAPVFIVGCGRSGTTFLLKCLSFADKLLCLHQPLQIWLDAFPQFNIWTEESHQLLRVGSDFFSRQKLKSEKIYAFYQALLSESNKIMVIDKQPQNVFKLHFLNKMFPKMKVIYIERNIKSVCESINKFQLAEWYGKNAIKFDIFAREAQDRDALITKKFNQYEMAEIEWKESQKIWLQYKNSKTQQERNESICQISFQNLMKNLPGVLNKVCNFLRLNGDQSQKIIEGGAKILMKRQ